MSGSRRTQVADGATRVFQGVCVRDSAIRTGGNTTPPSWPVTSRHIHPTSRAIGWPADRDGNENPEVGP